MMTPTPPGARSLVPHRLASSLLALLPSAALLLGAVFLVRSWRDELPDPLAVHFGTEGADGFDSLTRLLVVPVAIVAALAVAAWLLATLAGRAAGTRRVAVGLATGMSAFGAVLVTGVAWEQRGLATAATATTPVAAVLVATTAGLTLGALAAWAMPGNAPEAAAPPLVGDRMPLGAHERAVWTRRVVYRVGVAAGGGTAVVLVVLSAALGIPALLLTVPVLVGLVITLAVLIVTVDSRGLSVQSAVGWPRSRIPLEEVLGVAVTQIRPIREFGGWGYRVGRGGRVGYVVRQGEALQVERTGGRRFVVTVDDATTAAALLTTLVDRERAGRDA